MNSVNFVLKHNTRDVSVLYTSITMISNSLIHTLANLYLLATRVSRDNFVPCFLFKPLNYINQLSLFSH